jgi:hypothetical protein
LVQGRSVYKKTEHPVGENPGKGLDQAPFLGVGEGGKEAPACAVFEFPQHPGGGMAQYGPAAILPEVYQAATPLGVEPEIPCPEYRGQKPQ